MKWLDFKITNRCNNSCVYCGVQHDDINMPEILTIDEIKNTILDALSNGFDNFAFLGGEPSIRNDVSNIFDAFKSSKNTTVLVITNGLYFNKEMLLSAFMSNAKIVKIVHSFDSFEENNYKNQNPKETLHNIKLIDNIAKEISSNNRLRCVEIHSVISRENISNFSDIVRYFRSYDIDVSMGLVCPSKFTESGKSEKYNEFNYEELNKIIGQLKDLDNENILNNANRILLEYLELYPYGKLDMKSTCKAGKEHVIINPDGSVFPCITESYRRNLFFGNIKDRTFSDIYESMSKFVCEGEIAPGCWDHFLWNKLI